MRPQAQIADIRTLPILLSLLLTAALLTACAGLPTREAPVKRYYVLETPRPDKPTSTRAEGVLKVRTLRIAPRYDDKEMVIRTGPSRFESDYYNLFFAPLGPMLAGEVSRHLGGSGVFANVIPASSRAEADLILEGNVTALHADYTSQPKAVMEIQFLLLRESGNDPVIEFHRDYRREVPLSGRGPDAVVAGLDAALGAVLSALAADLDARPTPLR